METHDPSRFALADEELKEERNLAFQGSADIGSIPTRRRYFEFVENKKKKKVK